MTYTPPTGPATGPTSDEQSARAIIQQTLDSYGLGQLGEFAWNLYLSGAPVSQILLDIRGTPEYKARFPAMADLAQQGRAISEQSYIEYERNASSLMRSYGLPEGFYDTPDDFTRFISNGVALPELKDRLDQYQTLIYHADPDTLSTMRDYYQISDGGILAAIIDPDRALPLLEKQVAAAQLGGAATRTGYGSISRQQAEYLTELGISPDVAAQGFGELANQSQALQGLPGWDRSPVSTDQALAAQFGGNAEAQRLIEQRQLELLAANKQGGQVASTQKGAVGAGVAQ